MRRIKLALCARLGVSARLSALLSAIDYKWRVDIQKGVTHNFSKIVFLATKILEVNANANDFFFQSEIFLFSTWKSKICISRCRNGNVFVPPCKISEMWVTPFWMFTLQIIINCLKNISNKNLNSKNLKFFCGKRDALKFTNFFIRHHNIIRDIFLYCL